MARRHQIIKAVALFALSFTLGNAQANLTVITDRALFSTQAVLFGTDNYADLTFEPGGTTMDRFAGNFAYTANVLPDDPTNPGSYFFPAGNDSEKWLSTNRPMDGIELLHFTGQVRAIGGEFFGSDITGAFLAGQAFHFTATDANGSLSFDLTNAQLSSFAGFVSDSNIVSLSIHAVQPTEHGQYSWISGKNLTIGGDPSPVPEPTTSASLLLGLGLGTLCYRRRQRT